MKINNINPYDKIYGLNQSKDSGKTTVSSEKQTGKVVKGDRLDISSDMKKVRVIKERIEAGVYENDELLNELAKRLIDYSAV
ncbi:MAG: hypothetical protein WC313_09215 [Candidatus Kapaibacterium sp.]|jgi:anti-sigma28 factor (negative regulator of flagellin synthesis)|nr:hypothetical protein [Candidatus Kapabacteria bacterium]